MSQTDAGNRLTVVNNDGTLNWNTESDLVLDLRGLSQSKWVTFVGANGVGNAGISSNRIVVDDISANQNQILDGGDTDVRVTTTPGYVAGNNNVYEVRNTANVSINDLAQVRNFGLINFTNDQAVAQTLTLTLNNTVVENLVDTSNTAVSAATQEVLAIVANDNGLIASALNIDARQVTGFHALNVTGSANGNDVLTLNSNLGGTANVVDLGAVSAGDRVNWTGGAAGTAVTIDLGADGNAGGVAAGNGFATFQLGAVTTTHDIDNVEIVDLTGLTYATATVAGTAAAETFIGGAGVDTFTGGAGNDRFVVGNNDTVTDFVSGADVLDLAVAGTAANYSEAADADLGAAFGTAASLLAAQAAYVVQQAVTLANETYTFIGNSNAGGAGGYLFVDANNDGAADSVILLAGIGAAGFAFGDIV